MVSERNALAAAFVAGALVTGVGVYGAVAAGFAPVDQSGSADATGALQADLADAHLWIGGTVARVADETLSVTTNDVVVPVSLRNGAAVFRCQPGATGDVDCGPIAVAAVEPGSPVCVSVYVRGDTVRANKAFVNATCAGPQTPPA